MWHPAELRSRATAVAILAGLLFGLWAAARPLAEILAEKEAAIDEAQRLLAGYRQRTSRIADLERERAALAERRTSDAGLLDAANGSSPSANLQASVRRTLQTNDGMLRSLQILPPTTETGNEKIALRVDASLPLSNLLPLLYELRTSTPRMLIERIELRSPEYPAGDGDTQLSLRADIYGYAR